MSYKESPDVVDLTTLQKRGIIKKEKPIEKTHSLQTDSSGYVSLFPVSTPAQKPVFQPTQETNTNPLAFFDSFANTQTQTETQTNVSPNTDSLDFKIKLENLEYKLERLMEKLALIESKVQNFEDKVSRES